MNKIKAFSPATLANFNVGFDILGLALHSIGDVVEVSFNESENNAVIDIINGEGIPYDYKKNCCTVAIAAMQNALKTKRKVDVKITKGFASGSGMGSSSASSAAAVFAFNALMEFPMNKKQLIQFAAEGEKAACGASHLDNVAPAILGGLVLVSGIKEDEIISLPIFNHLKAVCALPKLEIKTSKARGLISEQIPLKTSINQTAHMAKFVSSLYENNVQRFSESMQDLIAEPLRKSLIPKYDDLKTTSLENGALSFGISGSGPTVFAVCEEKDADKIANDIKNIWIENGIECFTSIFNLNNPGSKLID